MKCEDCKNHASVEHVVNMSIQYQHFCNGSFFRLNEYSKYAGDPAKWCPIKMKEIQDAKRNVRRIHLRE